MKRSGPIKHKSKPTRTTKDGRLILSLGDWLMMKREMWRSLSDICGRVMCHICWNWIYSYEDFEPDHIIPRGLGGGTRDDRPFNIQPSHRSCNRDKGSKRLTTKEKA